MAMPLIPFSIENKNTNHGAMEDKVDVVLLRVGDSNNSMIAFRHTTTMTKTVDVTMNNASIIILRGRKKKLRKKSALWHLLYIWQNLRKHQEDN